MLREDFWLEGKKEEINAASCDYQLD